MNKVTAPQRYVALYLPAVVMAAFAVYVCATAWLSISQGWIEPIRGPDRIIVLAHSPAAFWAEVAYQTVAAVGGLGLSAALAWGMRSNYESDRIIRGRFERHEALDKAVRRPLEP